MTILDPSILYSIPPEVWQAERTLSRWFAENNITDWKLGHCQARVDGPQWKPMDTAPETGVFLVYMPAEREKDRIQVAKWHPNVKVIGGCFAFDRKPATHWMPLPAEPEGE